LTPDWYDSAENTVKRYGWDDRKKPERTNLYTTLKYGKVNKRGFSSGIDGNNWCMFHREGGTIGEFTSQKIEDRFCEKLPALIFAYAETRGKGAEEEYWFNEIYYCKDLNVDNLPELLKADKLILETRMWLDKETGKLRDRGFAFRMNDKDLLESGVLFGNVERLV
tara:strand:+ start:39 stop:536 length:498 start_codon:yes stop_codon:yes gene_type:complete